MKEPICLKLKVKIKKLKVRPIIILFIEKSHDKCIALII